MLRNKAEGKREALFGLGTQVPVTDPTPHVSNVIPFGDHNDKLPVIHPETRETLLWVDVQTAQQMIKSGRAVFFRTKKKIRGLYATCSSSSNLKPAKPTVIRQRGTTGDSHKHERKDNPAGVWTIDRLARNKRAIFTTVVDECMTSWQQRFAA